MLYGMFMVELCMFGVVRGNVLMVFCWFLLGLRGYLDIAVF